jgi:hypothetical protein
VANTFDELVRSEVERFQEKIGLRPGADLQMILLKAHLLIEEELQAFIDRSVRDASLLKKARFTFAQRLILAEAIHPAPNFRVWLGVGGGRRVKRPSKPDGTQSGTEGLRDPDHRVGRAYSRNILLQGNLMLIKPGKRAEYEMATFGLMVSLLNVCLTRLLHFEASRADG